MDLATVETLESLPRHNDFIQVPVDAIRLIGPNAAILLSRLAYRFEGGWRLLHQHGDHHWWEATAEDLGAETGMSADQVRRALKTLIEKDAVVREKHHLGGASDHSYSYRLRTAEEARSLLPTDVAISPHRENTDVAESPHRSGEIATSSSPKTSRNFRNADDVGEDDLPVDKSGPFRLTPARAKLVMDAMVIAGQAHAAPTFLGYLQRLSWGEAQDLIRRWCGIQAAAQNGDGYRRADIDDLLAAAGIPPTDDATWNAMLAEADVDTGGHGARCRYEESGYCLEHGMRETGASANAR